MRLIIALLFAVLFLQLVTAKRVCKRVVYKSKLIRRTKRVPYRRAVATKRRVRGWKNVCKNEKYRFFYWLSYTDKVNVRVRRQVRYQHVVRRTVSYLVKCRKKRRRSRRVGYWVWGTKPCVRRKKVCRTLSKLVKYRTTCLKTRIVRYRVSRWRWVPATCRRKERYPVWLATRRRCTKYKWKKYWTGRYRRVGDCYYKVWGKKRVPYNTWCKGRRRVWRWRWVNKPCKKRQKYWVWKTKKVVRKVGCTKYKRVTYRSCRMVPYQTRCRVRVKRTKLVWYWQSYWTKCQRRRVVRVKVWRLKWVWRTKLVTRVRRRRVWQWRTKSTVVRVRTWKWVYRVKHVRAYRSVHYYVRKYYSKVICKTV